VTNPRLKRHWILGTTDGKYITAGCIQPG